MKDISRLAVACLLLLAFCGCGKNESQTTDASLTTIGCAANLRAIDAAKTHWATSHGAGSNDTPSMDDLEAYFRHGPGKCPEGGTYTLGKVDELPQCSIAAHNDYFKAHVTPEPPPAP